MRGTYASRTLTLEARSFSQAEPKAATGGVPRAGRRHGSAGVAVLP